MRHRRLGEWLFAALAYAILAAVFFAPVVFEGKTLMPADLLYHYPPWDRQRVPDFAQPSNWILFDEVFEFLPWRHFTESQLDKGLVPLWNPWNFCGHPFLALLQPAVFYPPARIFALWGEDLDPGLSALFHVWLAAFGMFLLLRHWKIRWGGAFPAGVAFGFSSFLILWAGHPHSKAAAWIPWLFLAIDRGIFYQSRLALGAVAAATALQFAAGHIETSLHVFWAAAIFFGVRMLMFEKGAPAFKTYRRKGLAAVIVAAFLGGSMLLLQTIPFAEYLVRSSAYDARKEGVWTRSALHPGLMACLLVPKLFGTNADRNYWWQEEGKEEGNTNEISSGYVGVLTLLLALLALSSGAKRQIRIPFLAVLLFSLGVAYGWPGIYSLSQHLPFFKMSYNFRFTIIVTFALSALAGIGVEAVYQISSRKEKEERTKWLLAWFLLLMGTGLLLVWWALRHMSQASLETHILNQLRVYGLFLVMGFLAVFTALTRRKQPWLFGLAAAGMIFGDLYVFGAKMNPALDTVYANPVSGMRRFIQKMPVPSRVFPVGHLFPPHLNMRVPWDDPRGNDALTPLEEEQYLALIDPEVLAPHMLPALRLIRVRRSDSNLVEGLGAQYVAAPFQEPLQTWPGRRLVYEGDARLWSCARSRGLAAVYGQWVGVPEGGDARALLREPFFDPLGTLVTQGESGAHPGSGPATPAETLSWKSHELTLRALAVEASRLFLAVTWFPGWKATVNGLSTPILRANHAFMALKLPAGSSEVRLTYEPVSYRLGLFLSGMALALLLCGLLLWQLPVNPMKKIVSK